MIDVLSYWGVTFAILAFSIIPGYTIACFFKGLDDLERLSISFGLSFVMVIILTPLAALGYASIFRYSFLIISLTGFFLMVFSYKMKRWDFNYLSAVLFGIFVIQLIVKAFAQTFWEYPFWGGDWFIHAFQIPQSFSDGVWNPPQDRTCLFSVLIFTYHKLLNTSLYSYWISQLVSCIVNSAFIFPVFLIANRLFNQKIAIITVILTSLNFLLFFTSVYTWPKGLSTYFVLVMIYFLFVRRRTISANAILAGVSGGLAYLIHPLAVFYVFGSIGVLLLRKEVFTHRAVYYALAMGITLLPYFMWSYHSNGQLFSSRMIYYPIVNSPYDAVLHTPSEIIASFKATSVWVHLYNGISNRLYNVLSVLTNLTKQHPIFYFEGHLPRCMTFPLFILALIGIVKTITEKQANRIVLLQVILFSFLFSLLFLGFRQDDFLNEPGMQASIAILSTFAIYALFEIRDGFLRKLTASSVLAYASIQIPITFFYIIRFYNNDPGGREKYLSALGKTWHHVEGFDISRLVSAHFLINGYSEFILNLFVVLVIVSVVTFYIYHKYELTESSMSK